MGKLTVAWAAALVGAFLAVPSVAAQSAPPFADAAPQESRPVGIPGATPTRIRFAAAADCYAVTDPVSKRVVKSVDDLVAEYDDGGLWSELQADLEAVLSACRFAAPLSRLTPGDFTSMTFLVTLVSNDRQPYHVVVPQPQPYSVTLLGISSVNAIVLGDAVAKGDGTPNFMLRSTKVRTASEARMALLAVPSQRPCRLLRTGHRHTGLHGSSERVEA